MASPPPNSGPSGGGLTGGGLADAILPDAGLTGGGTSDGGPSGALAPQGAWGAGPRAGHRGARGVLVIGHGVAMIYLSAVVLVPLAALVVQSGQGGAGAFWQEVSSPESVAAIELTVACSAIVAVLGAVFGTATAWLMVRDKFPGRGVVGALIDLPFALPTIVAGLVLLTLYGKGGPVGIDITFTRAAIVLALLFVTFPFVVRSVQPVVMELDSSMEEAARSLGASGRTVLTRILLPGLAPAILSGAALSFARALGEYGSVVLISGNLPFKTEVASVYVFSQVSNSDLPAAAAVSIVLLIAAVVVLGGGRLVSRRSVRGG